MFFFALGTISVTSLYEFPKKKTSDKIITHKGILYFTILSVLYRTIHSRSENIGSKFKLKWTSFLNLGKCVVLSGLTRDGKTREKEHSVNCSGQ